MERMDVHAHLWLGHHRENAVQLREAAEKYGFEKILISALGSHQPTPEEILLLNEAAFAACDADPLF